MKINLMQPLGCGNAVRLVVEPTAGEARWRIVRKETADIASAFDPAAFLVLDGDDRFVTDSRLLVNGVTYHYAVYGEVSPGVWGAPAQASAVPAASFRDISVDPQELVRERLDVALQSMVQRGLLALTRPSLVVMSIPFYAQGIALPVVTVLYGNGASALHAIGEQVSSGAFGDSSWTETLGWHSAVTLEISAWSLNAQERNVLRRALEAAIAANLDVLQEQGLNMVEVQSVQDTEDTQSMNAPMYQTSIRLSCQVVVAVADEYSFLGGVVTNILGV